MQPLPIEMPAAVPWPELKDVRAIIFDFDGVFTDNSVYVLTDGREAVRCSRADGLGIELLRIVRDREGLDLQLLVLSREQNAVVQARASKLRLECVHATHDKLAALLDRYRSAAGVLLDQAVYLGNDVNDLAAMKRCRFSIAPADAHPLVRSAASCIMPQAGGHGFVRAVIDRFLNIEEWPAEKIDALLATEASA